MVETAEFPDEIKDLKEETLPISIDTIVRTILLFVTLINAIGTMFGWNPLQIDQAMLYQGLSAAALLFSTIWSWWKNNSFTQAALKGDKVMKELKSE